MTLPQNYFCVLLLPNSSTEAVMHTVPCFSLALCICRDSNLCKYVEKGDKKRKIPVGAIAVSTTSCLLTALNQSRCPRGELQNFGMTLAEHNVAYFQYITTDLKDFKTDVYFEPPHPTPTHRPPSLPPSTARSVLEFPAGGGRESISRREPPPPLHLFSCGFPPAPFY